jgi:hypothetical protein
VTGNKITKILRRGASLYSRKVRNLQRVNIWVFQYLFIDLLQLLIISFSFRPLLSFTFLALE